MPTKPAVPIAGRLAFLRRVKSGGRRASAADLRRIALSLEGTTEAPHFDRAAFKVARIYVTIVGDGLTAYLKFTADEQELKCLTAPDAFAPVPNAWPTALSASP